jgi:hypothetical protein
MKGITMQKDHLEILLESIDSKFQITIEAFSSLNGKIESVRDELIEKIEIVDCKVMGLSKRVDTLETNLNARIDSVETNLNARIDSVEANLSARMDELQAEMVSHRVNTELHRIPRKQPLKRVA